MGWKLVEVERVDTKTNVNLYPIVHTEEHNKDEQTTNFPDWYTEEDRKAKLVLEGCCKNCFHLWFVDNNSRRLEFKGFWCATFKRKLETKIDSCSEFYALGDEINKLIKEL